MTTACATPRPCCPVCGAAGAWRYRDLTDKLFGTPGSWHMRQCTAARCGLAWLDPPPASDAIAAAYAGYYTHQDVPERNSLLHRTFRSALRGYRARRFGYATASVTRRERTLGALVGAIPPLREYLDAPLGLFAGLSKGRLLELGCGGGATLRLLADWGWSVEGIDFDAGAVANAAAKGLAVSYGDIFSRGYPDASFDVVYSSHVIEHVPDPRAVLAECRRILKPGGHCITVTPNVDALGHRWFGPNWRGLEPPRHLQIFSTGALDLAMRHAGFSVHRLSTSCRGAAGAFIDSRRIRAGRSVFEPISPALRAAAELAHVAAMAYRIIDPRCGEELICVGRA